MTTPAPQHLPRNDSNLEVSFEFFPPKTDAMMEQLWQCVKRLEPLRPKFVSVTYGAGGSTRERTHSIVRRIQDETGIRSAAHLTCVGATRAEVDAVAREYWSSGIRHIVALRGDPPAELGLPEGDLAHASDLVALIREVGDFSVAVEIGRAHV